MEFYENIHFIADSNKMIIGFTNFCEKVHDQIECKREDCEFSLLAVCLVDFLKKDKTMAERRRLFISHSNSFLFLTAKSYLFKKPPLCVLF